MASKSFTFEDGPNFRGTTRRSTVGGLDEPEIAAPQRGGVPDFRLFGNIDLAAVSPAIGVTEAGKTYTPMSRGADYMFEEEERERGFGENLVFYTGSAYITGFASGTFLGVFEGLRKAKHQNLPQNLRVNAIVNACSKRGQNWGNNLGVIALMFTSFERLSLYARDKDDAMNAINAATLTGALFKSTTGLRQSIAWAILGGLGMTLVTVTGYASTVLNRAKVNPLDLGSSSDDKKKVSGAA